MFERRHFSERNPVEYATWAISSIKTYCNQVQKSTIRCGVNLSALCVNLHKRCCMVSYLHILAVVDFCIWLQTNYFYWRNHSRCILNVISLRKISAFKHLHVCAPNSKIQQRNNIFRPRAIEWCQPFKVICYHWQDVGGDTDLGALEASVGTEGSNFSPGP